MSTPSGATISIVNGENNEETVEITHIDPTYSSDYEANEDPSELAQPVDPAGSMILELVREKKWAVIYASIEDASTGMAPLDLSGDYLLHTLCKVCAPLPIVECVLKANTTAASIKGKNGFLPLHYACQMGASVGIVEALLDVYPVAVKVPESGLSRLPLHFAARCEGPSTAEVITLLMSYYPEATQAKDSKGFRPIEYAANTKNACQKTRWESIAVLEMGEKWIRVGQNVTERLEKDFAERLRTLEKDFGSYVDSLKAVHDEEIARIANDLLDDDETETKEKMQALVVENADIVELVKKEDNVESDACQKYDRFMALQEETRRLRLEIGTLLESNIHGVVPAAQKAVAHGIEVEKSESSSAFATVEDALKQSLTIHTTTRFEQDATEKEKKLMARITALEKAERLKTGVIKKITTIARSNAKSSQEHIANLANVVHDQQTTIDLLMAKLDLCEEQLNILKHSKVETE